MVTIALILNIAVLIPVLTGLLRGRSWVDPAFGKDTPARRILACVYLAIAGVSLLLLPWDEGRTVLAPGLLVVQVVYKVATIPALGFRHPVARVNLAIALFHALALASLL